jgi:hypothetical protein
LIARGSCGWSPRNYDVTCLGGLELRVVADGTGQTLSEHCTSVAGRFTTLNDLVVPSLSLELLEDLHTEGTARIEVRGYHALDKAGCGNPSESDLLLWGSSDLVDLHDSHLRVITVQIECRPDCDCAAIGGDPQKCPAALSPGVCAGPKEVLCRKLCADDDDCYAGRLSCTASLCTPETGGLCAECASSLECTSGWCAQNTYTNESFCSARCPPEDNAAPCPTYMSCKRLGTTFVTP